MAKEVPKPQDKLYVAPKGHKKYSKLYKAQIWKNSERQLGKWLQANDDEDKFFKPALTSCGRIGHITGLRFDSVSKNFIGENKSRERIPIWFEEALINLLQKAKEWKKIPLMRLDIYGELNENVLDLRRLPDLMVIPTKDLAVILQELRRLRRGKNE